MFPRVSVEVYRDRRLKGVLTTESISNFIERELLAMRIRYLSPVNFNF